MGLPAFWTTARRAGRNLLRRLTSVLRLHLIGSTPNHLIIGRYGEWLARRYLHRNRCVIVATRWRAKSGELDIVAWDGPLLCFIEVKTRVGKHSAPEAAWTIEKSERVRNAAQAFLSEKRLGHVVWRIDLIAVRIVSLLQAEIIRIKSAAPGQRRRTS